jgi:hypothetical protein
MTGNGQTEIASKVTKFIALYAILTSACIALLVLLPSWLEYKASEAISFYADDGWCNSTTQGIGTHCFGDFYYTILLANLDNPWADDTNAYPSLTLFLYKFFAILTNIWPNQLALAVYMFLTLIPIVITVRHAHLFLFQRSNIPTSVMGFFCISASPILVAVDRGNNIILSLPMLYFFTFALMSSNNKHALFWGVCLTMLKPQLGIFILIFVISKQWVYVFKWILYVFIGYLIGFALYFKSFPQNIVSWIKQVVGYQNYGSPGSIFPINLSMSNLLEIPFEQLGQNIPNTIITLVTYCILILSTLIFVRFGHYFSLGSNIFVLSLFPIIFVSTSFHYYLILLLVPLLFVVYEVLYLSEQVASSTKRSIVFDFHLIQFTTASLALFIFIPWAIPYSLSSKLSEYGISIIGVQWFPSQILLNLLIILIIWRMWTIGNQNSKDLRL